VNSLDESLHPYVVFLPVGQKDKVLSAIFGSKAAVDILRYSLNQGISNKIYQKELVGKLKYSNKTIIKDLSSLTRLGVLTEEMEKSKKTKRVTWVKVYRLSAVGRWFALLIAEEKELTNAEKAEILQNLFSAYIRWVRSISEKLHVSKEKLEEIFSKEMKSTRRENLT